VAAWVVVVLWTGRRSAKGDNRFAWLVNVPLLFGGLAMIWAGINIAPSNIALAVVMVLVGAITTVLIVRAIRAAPAGYASDAYAQGMPEQWVDYLIWAAIGVPLLLAAVALLIAIADRYNRP
jgi:hypothetical protein